MPNVAAGGTGKDVAARQPGLLCAPWLPLTLLSTMPPAGSPYFEDVLSVFLTLLIVLGGGLIAFAMVWSEFMLIKCTSALTFMVAGTFKEIITGEQSGGLDSASAVQLRSCGLPPL